MRPLLGEVSRTRGLFEKKGQNRVKGDKKGKMKEVKLSRAVVISGAVTFFVLLIAVGLLAYKYFSGQSPSPQPTQGTSEKPVSTPSTISVPNPWKLSDEEIEEALQTGQSMHGDLDILSQFVREFYTQDLEGAGAPASKLVVLTPYLEIVHGACADPYFSFDLAKSIVEFPSLSLQFQVIAYGASIDFCSNLKAVLILPNGSAIYPIHQQVPSFAYQNGEAYCGGIFWPNLSPNEPYQAFCSWDFDASQIGRNDTVNLVLTRAEGEQRAVIDLSKYK